jgi:tetratricopeptide (TPR) repeat protein
MSCAEITHWETNGSCKDSRPRLSVRAKVESCVPLLCALLLFLACSGVISAQDSPSTPQNSEPSTASQPSGARNPDLRPPRSDRVNVNDLGTSEGQSSSKDTQIDLTPPTDDVKAHPKSSEMLTDVDAAPGGGDVSEMHPWDPHKAAKDIEVGDFYFKRKNYRAAEDRYREALYYKDNDAVATYRLAVCLEKLNLPEEARNQYESYLKILPNGPQAADAKKSIDRLKTADPDAKAAK